MECKWDPKSLPPLQKQDRKPSLIQAVCEMVFGWFGLIWLLLVPHYPFLIFGPAASFLKAGPLCHTFYLPIVMLAVVRPVAVGHDPGKAAVGWLPPLSQLMQTVLTLILLNFMLKAVSHAPRDLARHLWPWQTAQRNRHSTYGCRRGECIDPHQHRGRLAGTFNRFESCKPGKLLQIPPANTKLRRAPARIDEAQL